MQDVRGHCARVGGYEIAPELGHYPMACCWRRRPPIRRYFWDRHFPWFCGTRSCSPCLGFPPSSFAILGNPIASTDPHPNPFSISRFLLTYVKPSLVTEVDLCTFLPSRVPMYGWLPCSMTRLRLLSVQGLSCTWKGSSVDQDERLQLEAWKSTDLNRPSSL